MSRPCECDVCAITTVAEGPQHQASLDLVRGFHGLNAAIITAYAPVVQAMTDLTERLRKPTTREGYTLAP